MSYLEQLYSDKNSLESFKEKIYSITRKIDSTIAMLNSPINNAKANLIIDGATPLATELIKIRSGLVSKKNYLNGSIIFSVESEISYIENQIIEEKERLRQLEEQSMI